MPPERHDISVGVNLIVLSFASLFAFGDCGELLSPNKSEPSAIARTGKGRNERRGRREEDCLPAPSLAHLAESHITCGGARRGAGAGNAYWADRQTLPLINKSPTTPPPRPHAKTCS